MSRKTPKRWRTVDDMCLPKSNLEAPVTKQMMLGLLQPFCGKETQPSTLVTSRRLDPDEAHVHFCHRCCRTVAMPRWMMPSI